MRRIHYIGAMLVGIVIGFVAPIAAEVITSGFSGTAPSFTATAASGSNGFSCATNGCRFDIGAGTNDYFSSSGTVVTSNTNFTVTGDMILTAGLQGNGSLVQAGVVFANLGTPANGSLIYCMDCTIANPCAGAGTGAFAKRLNGAWICN